MLKCFFVLCLIVLLNACNAYHPLREGVGFMEVPVGTDTFQVSYAGSSSMPAAQARQFCLMRAAEIAVLHDAAYFQIQDEHIYMSYGTHYWPGQDTRFVETYPDRQGRARPYVYHVYEPGYTELYTTPEVEMKVHFARAGDANAIPAAYLLRQAQQDKIKLSPGVAERLATLPAVGSGVAIPPAPTPMTKPALMPPGATFPTQGVPLR